MSNASNRYSNTRLLQKYLQYYLRADNGKGHGIHSPFVYNLTIHVLRDKKKYPAYKKIEAVRNDLLKNNNTIEVQDMGAGSGVIKSSERSIMKVAASSLKPEKFAQLLYRIVQYYQPATIIELGTSFAITTSYLALGNRTAKVVTLEGAHEIANIARRTFIKTECSTVELVEGNFEDTLKGILDKLQSVDLAFVDGNHKRMPTTKYFEALLEKAGADSIFIFDDIHWSKEMEAAWKQIQEHPQVTLTVDLFFIGLVFFTPSIKAKQHFMIRF